MNPFYRQQFQLMLSALECSLCDKRFALKGGTAINVFYRNLPRLSVDIDLQYLPVEDRESSYNNIYTILKKIKDDIEDNKYIKAVLSRPLEDFNNTKLTVFDVRHQSVKVKIEPNYILRGHVFKPEMHPPCERVKTEFNFNATIQCLSFADVFGGKICAALDRQHPRDLFDVKILLKKRD